MENKNAARQLPAGCTSTHKERLRGPSDDCATKTEQTPQ